MIKYKISAQHLKKYICQVKLQPRTFKYRSYRNFDNDAFLNELFLIPYHVIDVFDEIDDSYWIWHELTMQIVNEHASTQN